MKTTFDKTTRDELISRINTLNKDSKAQWGKMNIYQMLKHCTLWEEMILNKVHCKRSFLGRFFGKMALRGFIKDESPVRRSTPTSPELKVNESTGDVAAEKKKWLTLLEGHVNYSDPYFVHPFFGKMTKKQVGYLDYKHIDHHLRQFNS
jgi:hypothetical protein